MDIIFHRKRNGSYEYYYHGTPGNASVNFCDLMDGKSTDSSTLIILGKLTIL